VITTHFAAQKELCWGGWLIEGEPEFGWQNAFVLKPGVAGIVDALEAAYADRGNSERRQTAMEGAREYHIDYVMVKYMLPVLQQIAEMTLDSTKVAV
jgi:hypothetical protein